MSLKLRIVAISGSLRQLSSNTTLLRAAATLAPDDVVITLYNGLGTLPQFNPDLEGSEPSSVLDYRALLKMSDGVLISSPEYAHGIPGSLKNALDWVVASGEFIDKPVALLNASPRATLAQASLAETIKLMCGRIIPEASVTVPLLGTNLDERGIVAHPEMVKKLSLAIIAFAEAIKGGPQLEYP